MESVIGTFLVCGMLVTLAAMVSVLLATSVAFVVELIKDIKENKKH